MGIHLGPTGAELFLAMAGVRLPDGGVALAMDGNRQGGGGAANHLLRAADPDVHPELRAGGLGHP